MDAKLPEGWVNMTLGEVGVWSGGGTPDKARHEFWMDGNIPWVSPKDMKALRIYDTIDHLSNVALREISLKLYPVGSILIVVRSGILAKTLPVAITQIPTTINQDMKSITPYKGINPAYIVYYLIFSSRDILSGYSKYGTTVASINSESLKNYNMPVAPTAEQNRIVSIIEEQFTRLDSAVASLHSAQAKAKQFRASLLKSAVEGELTKDWRDEHPVSETGAQLLERILNERRARWEDEQLAKMREKGVTPKDDTWKQGYREPEGPDVENLGELPEGWCWATVEQLAAAEDNSITDGPFGSNLKTEHYKASGLRVIRLKNIGDGFFKDEKAFISQDHFDKLRKHRIFTGDLVIAALGEHPPRSCIIPNFVGPAIVKADCIRYKVSPHALNTYINIVLNAEPTKKRTSAMLHGVGRPRLNLSEIKSIAIAFPPIAEQQCIMSEVEAQLSEIAQLEATLEASLKRAENERQSILREAFAGRLVEQDVEDEPASVLLERIREERKKRELVEQVRKREKQMAKGQERAKHKKVAPLYDVLADAGGELTPEELYKRSKELRKEKPEVERVEEFYVALHAEMGVSLIEGDRPATDKIVLSIIEQEDEELEEEQEEHAPLLVAETKAKYEVSRPSLWDE